MARCPLFICRGAVVLLVATGLSIPDRSARGQACCASAGLVAPTRLRSYEDFAVGVQGKARSEFGAFGSGGVYARNGAGESVWNLEQDLFGVTRVGGRGQVALLIPFVETRRALSGVESFGGGIGDLAVNARYDFTSAGEHRILPGLAVVLGLVVPTGTPPERSIDPTGQGSYEGSIGVGVEQAYEPYFVAMTGLLGLRSARSVAGMTESFSPRFTGLLAVGRVLPRGATAGAFVSVMKQGENRYDPGETIVGSDSSLVTAGLASTVSVSDEWRVQATASANMPVGGWGRNETAGIGVSVSGIRLWP